jgi:FeS assembly SUF system protein
MDEPGTTRPPDQPVTPPAAGEGAADGGHATDALRQSAIEAISTVFDPEIPVNIYELGLIYSVDVLPGDNVEIVMTLTSPMCPVAESLPGDVEMRVREVDEINDVNVMLTWEPPWTPDLMSEAAKLELGFM